MSRMLALQAWRSWRHGKGVAVLAAAALTIGIGAATALYTVVNAVMLRPLPYRDGGRFVAIFGGTTTDPRHFSSLQSADARAYADGTQAFDAFGWFREAGKNLMFAGEPHHVQGVAVTLSLVTELGVAPLVGGWFTDGTGVVVSHSLWQRLGGDAAIVGRTLTLDGRPYTVTGVTPASFRLPVVDLGGTGVRTDVWTALDPAEDAGAAYFAYARRKPSVSIDAATADATRIASAIASADPIGHADYTARVFDLQTVVVKEIRPTLLLLSAAALLLFLIACANAAGLLLARSVARARDTATRVSLGAGRRDLARLYFVESVPVAVAGTIGGLVTSLTLTPAIVSLAAAYIPRAEEVVLDWTVLLFALVAGFVATCLAGLAPLWSALRTAPADALGDGARTTAGVRSRRLTEQLLIGEIALAFALLAVSTLLTLHLRDLQRTSPGFDPDNLVTFTLSLPGHVADDQERRVQTQTRFVDALRAIPGVQQAAFSSGVPLDGCCFTTQVYAEGRVLDRRDDPRTSIVIVSPGYFETMRLPLRRGRPLTGTDRRERPLSMVVSESAARTFWPDRDPIGATGRFDGPDGSPFEVVGVVGDVKNDGLGKPAVPEVYLSALAARVEAMKVVVRGAGRTESLMPAIRQAIAAIDPEQPIHDVALFDDIARRSVTLERVASVLTTFFAATALLMASLGIYGVLAYAVRQRTVEIGTRLAIGASGRDIMTLIVGGGLRTALYGVLAGALLAVAAMASITRAFEVGGVGPAPLLYATAVVGTVAMMASALPAWRASLLSPMAAIRHEAAGTWSLVRGRAAARLREVTDEGFAAATLGPLITEVAAAMRRADTVPDASRAALEALRSRAGARTVTLLESSGDEYRSGELAIPAQGFLLNRLAHYPHPLPMTERDFEAWLRWARAFKPHHVAEIERLARGGVRMAVPLRTRTDVVGVLLLGAPARGEGYSRSEKQLLRGSADVFALMIENGRLTHRAVEQEKLRKDVALAAEVQRRLLPAEAPSSPVATCAAFTLPARSVGGDYYDFFDLRDGRVGIAVADVSGKGVAAALLMSVVQASLRVIASAGAPTPADVAARMNAFLYQSTGANKYATFFYAEFDPSRRRLAYVNAGHNPPILIRLTADGPQAIGLAEGGTVIGLFPDMTYQGAELDLQAGDLLVAYTDGVSEALNAQDEEFGEARLEALLIGAVGASAGEIAARLTAAMRAWIGAAEQHDDLTFVVVALR